MMFTVVSPEDGAARQSGGRRSSTRCEASGLHQPGGFERARDDVVHGLRHPRLLGVSVLTGLIFRRLILSRLLFEFQLHAAGFIIPCRRSLRRSLDRLARTHSSFIVTWQSNDGTL